MSSEIDKKQFLLLPYPLECNPRLLFSVMGFWVGFYSNLSYLGLYLSWASINYSLMGPEQTLQPLSLFIKFINFLLAFKRTFWELIILNQGFLCQFDTYQSIFHTPFLLSNLILIKIGQNSERFEQRELLIDKKFGKVGLYSSWACFVSTLYENSFILTYILADF